MGRVGELGVGLVGLAAHALDIGKPENADGSCLVLSRDIVDSLRIVTIVELPNDRRRCSSDLEGETGGISSHNPSANTSAFADSVWLVRLPICTMKSYPDRDLVESGGGFHFSRRRTVGTKRIPVVVDQLCRSQWLRKTNVMHIMQHRIRPARHVHAGRSSFHSLQPVVHLREAGAAKDPVDHPGNA